MMSGVEAGTTIFDVMAAFVITVLERNYGNRTWTSEELKIPLRTFRNRIWQLESYGYDVPSPQFVNGGHQAYLKKKSTKKCVKKTKLNDF
jgi:hypothetical protein